MQIKIQINVFSPRRNGSRTHSQLSVDDRILLSGAREKQGIRKLLTVPAYKSQSLQLQELN